MNCAFTINSRGHSFTSHHISPWNPLRRKGGQHSHIHRVRKMKMLTLRHYYGQTIIYLVVLHHSDDPPPITLKICFWKSGAIVSVIQQNNWNNKKKKEWKERLGNATMLAPKRYHIFIFMQRTTAARISDYGREENLRQRGVQNFLFTLVFCYCFHFA